MPDYTPGVCNIGPAERRKRLLYGSIAFLVAGTVVAGGSLGSIPALVAFTVLLTLGFLGIFQYRSGFCAGFAAAGMYDVSVDGNARQQVDDPANLSADRRKAATLVAMALGSSLALTVVTLLVR